ncbi:hypothetical protein BKA61DRAFT_130119 [Leptodontidium sp. MPI-SDFR-AT-0119]|nr:hypothetical protein BKA61DRAFT_130119 [Leptodontidium sp. MPI-SDFR-AT-0119]
MQRLTQLMLLRILVDQSPAINAASRLSNHRPCPYPFSGGGKGMYVSHFNQMFDGAFVTVCLALRGSTIVGVSGGFLPRAWR